ncbi:MAG TPA: DUF853 family protein [Alphaproteobacteria bacterium]|nr:DUF853 family protein [Alphaproteobacteria bacterium]HOO51214.1 DUF853 family protein [Alphaproteobacteria bacterium]
MELYVGSQSSDSEQKINLLFKRANRHGLIAGATGTGKTVTLQILAEGFAAAGVPVFITDVKGDLSGLAEPSQMEDFLVKRAGLIGLDPYSPQAFPVIFWDMFGKNGHPVRTTISEMGPLLLSRLLELNDTQQGVLDIVFRVADDQSLLLLDLKDLRAMLTFVAEHSSDISKEYGNVSGASVAAIQRALLRLEEQGGDQFFGEPAVNLQDFMRTSYDGRGFVSILNAVELFQSPRLYATFLLWLLSELFEDLPEVGDPDKPKLVLFFDEAHLLFHDMPKALLEKIEQVVRLIRSKGVGVYFVTQNPGDIPDSVLGQLGNKIQHALRAYTPAQKKDIRAVVEGFRENPVLDVETVVQELKVGEALVSVLGEKGEPSMVDRVLIRPPSSKLGQASAEVIARYLQNSPVGAMYTQPVDRESAYELLQKRAEKAAQEAEEAQEQASRSKDKKSTSGRSSNRQGVAEALLKSVVRSVGSSVGRQIARELLRGVLGSLRK